MIFDWIWKNRHQEADEDKEELEESMPENVEEKLREAEIKYAESADDAYALSKAAKKARIIQHRVDRFTAEISDSFRILNHG